MRRRLALVVQRYGTDVTGGSESLARAMAERLAATDTVTVFTTCARDYVRWRNELPAGTQVVNGVEVRRFRVEAERDLDAFNAFSATLYDRPHSEADETSWLRRQGPFVPGLIEALAREKGGFDAIVFFTYLYYPTVEGLKAAPERSILVPTTHDEPPLRFGIYADAFRRARAFAFLTEPEARLVRSRFDLGQRPAVVAGIGVDLSPVDAGAVARFKRSHGLDRPYLLYAGRIDAGKGCDTLLAAYEALARQTRAGVDLVLIGTLALELPEVSGVRYLGFLPEAEKRAAIAGALAVACPSAYESLSITLLEGMSLGIPALATSRSAVLEDHCLRSNAGLVYRDAREFGAALQLLRTDPELRAAMGANGQRYVAEHYMWSAVLGRYRHLIESVATARP